MQLKQLAYFAAVVEHGSISRAAANLYLAQSSLSQSIQTLEQELGFKLLKRGRDGVLPTKMGESVYTDVKGLLVTVEQLTEGWRQTYRENCALSGLVRIGTVPGAHPILMKQILSEIRESCPNIRYKVLEARGPLLPTYLAQGQVDLILGDFIETDRPEVEAFFREHDLVLDELCSDHYKIAVGRSRALAKSDQLRRSDTRTLPLACYCGGDAAAELYFSHSFDRDISMEYTSIEKMVQEAINGPGVSVLPELTIRNTYPDALRFLTVEGFSVPFVHCVGYCRGAAENREITVTLQMIRKVFKEKLQ